LRIESDSVVIGVGGREQTIRGDSIIVAGEAIADTSLAQTLEAEGISVYSIGDSTGLGLIVKATRTAAEAVAKL
jgi:2,4-dienoyl-CoA reductase (NADPH2)